MEKTISLFEFHDWSSGMPPETTQSAELSSRRRVSSHRELFVIIMLSALGGAVSVPIGYAGNLLKSIPVLPFGTGQALSGIHVLWILLAGVLVKRAGAGTITGILKGLVELSLFSFHGFTVLLVSSVEGVFIDLALAALGRRKTASLVTAGGLSSSSNVIVLWLTLLQDLPSPIVVYMFVVSFVSGCLFAGYLGTRVVRTGWFLLEKKNDIGPQGRT